jgi:hypothetical protein
VKDIWFSDARDIVKWGVVAHLVQEQQNALAVQLAFYRQERASDFALRHLREGDDVGESFPHRVLEAFERRVSQIKEKALGFPIELYDAHFIGDEGDSNYRTKYLSEFNNWLTGKRRDRSIVLLVDPDTGLKPASKKGPAYVKAAELKFLYDALLVGDWLVLYQHAPRKEEWIEEHLVRVAHAVGVAESKLHVFDCSAIAEDVAFFAVKKNV